MEFDGHLGAGQKEEGGLDQHGLQMRAALGRQGELDRQQHGKQGNEARAGIVTAPVDGNQGE